MEGFTLGPTILPQLRAELERVAKVEDERDALAAQIARCNDCLRTLRAVLGADHSESLIAAGERLRARLRRLEHAERSGQAIAMLQRGAT